MRKRALNMVVASGITAAACASNVPPEAKYNAELGACVAASDTMQQYQDCKKATKLRYNLDAGPAVEAAAPAPKDAGKE